MASFKPTKDSDYPDTVKYNNEIAYKSPFNGYYCTKSGIVITIKVKGGQGRIDPSNPREHWIVEDKDGYYKTNLNVNGKHIDRRVHRLIWETFNGDIENDMTVDHIDNNCKNNKLENLQLLTRVDNGTKRAINHKCGGTGLYEVYLNGNLLETVKKDILNQKYSITKYDLRHLNTGKTTNRLDDLAKKGYMFKKM